MKKYIEPKLNVVEISNEDTIATSPDPYSTYKTTGDVDEYVKEERGWENVGW